MRPMKAIGVIGYSNSGKTTLIEQLIPLFAQRGLRCRRSSTRTTASTWTGRARIPTGIAKPAPGRC